MASGDPEVDLVIADDYYAWLGLSRDASPEQINAAFRGRSRNCHPDKHATDPEKMEIAEELFTRIKKAHEILSDPHKKAIYDTMGSKGLEADGWEVVARTKTPQEIVEEYERLQKENEERRLNQRTNPKGSINVSINATDLFDRYEALDSIEYRNTLPSIEISNMSISQSVECPLTTKDTAVLSGSLSSSNGNGEGSISLSCRRLVSHNGWAEAEIAGGNGTQFSIRGFRTLWKKGYGTMSGTLQLSPSGILKPGCSTTVATQIDKNMQGRITWNWGFQSSMTSLLLWDNPNHHVTCAIQLGLPSSFMMLSYTRKFTEQDAKLKALLRVGTFGAVCEYGCDKKITQFSRIGASVSIGVPSGVILRIRLNRGNQQYLFPIYLSEGIVPEAVFYGTAVPLLVYGAIKILVINPFMKRQQERDLKEKKEANMDRIREKKRAAECHMELSQASLEKNRNHEQSVGGLLITSAVYGKLHVVGEAARSDESIDVTDQLQLEVKDSRLTIVANTELSQFPGFYDPCIGERKALSIKYSYRNAQHAQVFHENEDIKLPKEAHRIS